MNTTIDPIEIAKFAKLSKVWWDAEGPLKTLHDINPMRLAYIKKIVPNMKRRTLDVGCGGGILSESLAVEGAKVTGLDAEKTAIEVARDHAKRENLSIRYVCDSIETFKAKPFPIITCMEMLEHVHDPSLVIAHLARLLSDDGYVLLSTINRTVKAYASVVLAAEYVLGILPRQTHDFQKFIKPSELAQVVRDYGLEVVDVCGVRYHPFTRKAELVSSVDVNYMMACRLSV
jgi:2-polyprenyl-6-hydroxyphenyl methylase/3-demethylubiquinone-9 3-methyltransferase